MRVGHVMTIFIFKKYYYGTEINGIFYIEGVTHFTIDKSLTNHLKEKKIMKRL